VDAATGDHRHEVLASDLSPRALEVARAGRYPTARLAEIPARFRDRHLVERGDVFEIAAPLRRRVRFSQHDLLGPLLAPVEAVIARFDLVLCRNVLIYLNARLQGLLVDRLASVVAPGGVLVLGPYESVPVGRGRGLRRVTGAPPHLNVYAAGAPR
jgi:two-component system, chemotaxis family, CheB/CheR fusion protein